MTLHPRRSAPTPARRPIPAADGPVIDPASFRDPAGFVFRRDGVLYRQVQPPASADWAAYHASGLRDRLVADGLVVDHDEVGGELAALPGAVAVIRPRPVEVISYPYEWSFSQLKDAALLTLELQTRALDAGMRLKDASAYNVQLEHGRPILIDTLSFEVAGATEPWPAYRQFCEHFLAPLALIAHRDARTGLLLRDFIDGIPLDLAATLLPGRTRLNLGLLSHLHLHAGAQKRSSREGPPATDAPAPQRRVSATGQRALLDSLRRTVEGLRWQPTGHWAGYAGATSYSDEATSSKAALVREMLDAVGGNRAWDLGANTGVYSAIAAGAGYRVVAWDQDAGSVEAHWLTVRSDDRSPILPLICDLSNPSPALGWGLRERRSFLEREEPDILLGLALVHHLAIGNNVPLPGIAELFARIAPNAIVEFVPKDDPMTGRLLAARRDIFDGYTIDGFRSAFGKAFEIAREEPIADSPRTLFLLRRR
ncbi:MAG TPA: SAM-dependent methyltransferase [Candidatus Limnocylindria bacterium]|nr:SAM-dependent methyltransferase [Candidatus Limnocylindria bacterium]